MTHFMIKVQVDFEERWKWMKVESGSQTYCCNEHFKTKKEAVAFTKKVTDALDKLFPKEEES